MGRASLLVWIVWGGLVAACSSTRPVTSGTTAEVAAALGPDVWAQSQIIAPGDEQAGDYFGRAMAISGSTALIGAPSHDNGSGAAYVLVRSGIRWVEQQKLVADSQTPGDYFGSEVALDGDTALATRRLAGAGTYVFVRSGATWNKQQELLPGDGAPKLVFGAAVALSGDTALVGATQGAVPVPGAAYVFVRSSTTWTEQQKLVPADSANDDAFATALALSGDTALVGAWSGYATPGAVYVFTRSNGVWSQQQKLGASDAAPGDRFGSSIAIDGDTAVVGAGQDAAYVFVRSGATWSEQQKLVQSAQAAPFGDAVALSGDTALIGANAPGSVGYVFGRAGSTWTEQQELVSPGSNTQYFVAVGLGSGLALVGGIHAEAGSSRDVALAFGLGPADGNPCKSDGDCASTHCADGVCCDTPCSGACDACSVAAGASVPGTCAILAKGSPGSPSCAPASCNGTSAGCPCKTNSDCPAAQDCVVSTGICVGAGATGTSCTANTMCAGGYCVDGVCCDSPCSSGCEVCSLAKGASAEGTCTPLPGGAVGGPGCGRYVCDGSGRCFTGCDSDAECAPDSSCSALGECIPPGGECSQDLTQEQTVYGNTDCAPYLCDPAAGKCEWSCLDDSDCTPGNECNGFRLCVGPEPDAGVRPGFYNGTDHNLALCSCRAAGGPGSNDAPLALMLGLLALAVRRSRSG